MGNEPSYSSPYKESYPYQQPKERDDYGNPIFTTYSPQYAYQNPTGRDIMEIQRMINIFDRPNESINY